MWRHILLVLTILALSAAGAGAAGGGDGLVVGQSFPLLRGDDLTGQPVSLPDAAAGRVTLLALGFSYGSRFAVEEWSVRFRDAFADQPGVTFYEIPMIGGVARLARPFIDRGMRKGTPGSLHGHVITVYGGIGPWRKRLGVRDKAAAYLVLLGPDGVIRWLHVGPFDEERFQQLRDEADGLAGRPVGGPG